MDSNWLMPAGRGRAEGRSEGARPSGTALIALVDQTDPAFLSIVGVLHEMRSAGVELDEQAVKAAIAMGHSRHKPARVRKDGVPNPDVAVASDDESIVYYIRRADLVKIGTTRRPHERFGTLLPDEILAWEPGSLATENARHQEFAEWRLGGSEYFMANDALDRHAERLRLLHGEPDPMWPTLASVSAIRARRLAPLSTPENVVLVTVGDGVQALGIKRNTADGWVHRKVLLPAGYNGPGRPLYLLAHMKELAERSGLLPRTDAA